MSLPDSIYEIHSSLKQYDFPDTVDKVVILGSGLGGFEKYLSDSVSIAYSDITGFPRTTITGHAGTLNVGNIGDQKVLVFAGRFHHYEGHPIERTILPVQLASIFKANTLLVSNAAGGINYQFNVGDLMLIEDIMRIGFKYSPGGAASRFGYYNSQLIKQATKIAQNQKIYVRQGTYLYVKGPSYETKAEIRAFRTLGADAVGMSTAPELLEACRLGMQCMGISLITNMATGVSSKKLAHNEIKEVAANRTKDFITLMKELILKM
ncbi:MAG TPA: purine-nucleoside phosphorylase [Balneolales bacterium]|nr:purine-nucleoside phosphorylase [Balneolales bacterium]